MKRIILSFVCVFFVACNQAKQAIDDAIDVVNVDRKPIDVSKTGVNAFGNDGRFGSMSSQYGEVKNTLGLSFVRILIAWDDNTQPSPSSEPNFSFTDAILDSIPAGVDVLAVLTGAPSWMADSSNWIDGDPGKTFVEKWVRVVASRYAGRKKLSALEIWNEPNMAADRDSGIMGFSDPVRYTAMLSSASAVVRSVAPGKRVLNAATTAINQNDPETLDYNKSMVEAGALNAVDIYAVHYYGEQFERVVKNNGVADFLNSLGKPIWITESGAQGVNNQLKYVERAWPFLSEKIPSIDRFYYYQFTEATDPTVTYGLRNLSTDLPVSDLYVYLRDR